MNYKRTIAEIDLDALEYNVENIKKTLNEKTKIIGTIKANAYGHGCIEVAKTLKSLGINIFSVATVDEGIYLRNNGINDEILILGYTNFSYMNLIVENNFTQTVSSLEEATELNNIATKLNKKINVHLKIDTGMTRLGFNCNEESIKDIIKINSSCLNTTITGIYSHLSTSDCLDKSFTYNQHKLFISFVEQLEKNKVFIENKHISNSGAIIDCKEMNMNYVRPGIMLYGLYPSEDVNKSIIDLKPVMTVKTQIAFIREIEKGTAISYGRTFIAEKAMKIATLPIGYADGFSRLLSNKGYGIVNGVKVPIVGRICMDQCMIDVTNVENVKISDTVVVMGKMDNEEISAEDIAETINTINYEVTCVINRRVPRIYIKNGKIIKEENYLL